MEKYTDLFCKISFILLLILIVANLISTFIECGFSACPG